MSNRRKLPRDYSDPQHRQGRVQDRWPSRLVGDLLALPGQACVMFLAAGALGSAALIAAPASVAASAPATSGTAGSPAVSLTADVQTPSASTPQSPLYLVPQTPPTAANPFVTLVPSTSPQPLPPGTMFALPNGKITSDPAVAAAAVPLPAPATLPADAVTYGPTPPDGPTGPSTTSPLPVTGPTPVTFYANYAKGIGGMVSYTPDLSGQTDGTASIGILFGWGANAGVRIGTPAPQGFDVSVPVTAMAGPVTGTATWDITNGSVAISGSVDGQTRALPVGSTGWSAGATYIQNSDGTWTVLPRGSVWGSADPQLTVGLAVSFPLPKDFVSTSVQAIGDAASYEAGLVPPQQGPAAAPAQPAPEIPALMPGGPTLDQLMPAIAPSQGFPDPGSVNANSGLAWLAQQPPTPGMSFQDIINTYSQAPAPAPAPAPEQHGQADQSPVTNVASSSDVDAPANNGPSGAVAMATTGSPAPVLASADDTSDGPATPATTPSTGGTGGAQTADAQPDLSQPDTNATMVTMSDPTDQPKTG
jgi:hypothetical protein